MHETHNCLLSAILVHFLMTLDVVDEGQGIVFGIRSSHGRSDERDICDH